MFAYLLCTEVIRLLEISVTICWLFLENFEVLKIVWYICDNVYRILADRKIHAFGF